MTLHFFQSLGDISPLRQIYQKVFYLMLNHSLIIFQVNLIVWGYILYLLYLLGNFLLFVSIFLFGWILSGFTLFVDPDRKLLFYMPGNKSSMSLGVVYLGINGVFIVSGVVSLWFHGVVSIRVTVGYMYNVFLPISLLTNPQP